VNPENVQDLNSVFCFSDSILYLITDRIQMTETLESEVLLRHLQINLPDSTNHVKSTNTEDRSVLYVQMKLQSGHS